MLILTRKPNESIILQDGDTVIQVVVTAAGGGTVKLGIDAPARFQVRRAEQVIERNRQDRQHHRPRKGGVRP